MKKTPYGDGVPYSATTGIAEGIARQLLLDVQVETPSFYNEHRIESVCALIDTGATGSVITEYYAEKLGLRPTSIEKSCGVNGIHDVFMYDVLLHLNNSVRDIELQVTSGKLNKNDGGPVNSDVGFLIGMDILGRCDFFTGLYKRPEDGRTVTLFSIRVPSGCCPMDYMQEVNDFNNKQVALQQRRKYEVSKKGTSKRKKRR
jgi:predicted aspartyl protease